MARKTTKRNVKSVRIPPRHGTGNKKPNMKGLKPFKKGERRAGRQKGTKNKLGVRIKEAVLEAIALVGKDGKGKHGATGYFMWLARAEPQVMGGILQKIMPTQVEVREKTDRVLTASEAVERLQERGLPVPPTLMSLAESVGRAVAMRQEEDEYDAELDGEVDGEEDDDDDNEQEEAA